MAAGDAHHPAAAKDAHAGAFACPDGVPHRQVGVFAGAAVAHRGDAVPPQGLCLRGQHRAHGDQPGVGGGRLHALAAHVNVTVHQAGGEGLAGAVNFHIGGGAVVFQNPGLVKHHIGGGVPQPSAVKDPDIAYPCSHISSPPCAWPAAPSRWAAPPSRWRPAAGCRTRDG